MLFYYQQPKRLKYWNRNVSFDIDVAFFDAKGELICVKELKAHQEESVSSEIDAQFVLEMRHGWFVEKNIGTGYVWNELTTHPWNEMRQDVP